MYMPAQIQLKTVKMVEIEPESDVQSNGSRHRLPNSDTPADVFSTGQLWMHSVPSRYQPSRHVLHSSLVAVIWQ